VNDTDDTLRRLDSAIHQKEIHYSSFPSHYYYHHHLVDLVAAGLIKIKNHLPSLQFVEIR